MGWHMDDWTWGGWVVMTIMMILVWGTIAGLVVFAIRSSRPPSPPPSDPKRILAGRFAAGEIGEDEYQRRLDALSGATKAP